jgi:hypothetical protein
MRHTLLACQCRSETDRRTFGELFRAGCEELEDISFVEALYRIRTLTAEQLRKIGSHCEKTASDIFDAIMKTALKSVGLSKNKLVAATA